MPQKIVGRVTESQANMYCDAGPITTRLVSYGVTRKVNSKKTDLVEPRKKTIRSGPKGRSVELECKAGKCPRKDEDIYPVKVVR